VGRLPGVDGPLARMGYAATFYPNAREARSARPLRLKPGQELAADFTLMAAPAPFTARALETCSSGSPIIAACASALSPAHMV